MHTVDHPWESIYRHQGRVFIDPPAVFKTVVREFAEQPCRRVLDLGCGNGRHVVALTKEGFNTIGLDISSTGLRLTGEWLEEEGLHAGLVNADARQGLPFQANSFDGLLSTQVIHHALLAEIRATIAEIWRVLTNGAIAFVSVAGRMDEEEPYKEVEPGTYVPLEGAEKDLPHHIFTQDELRTEFGKFQIVRIRRLAEDRVLAVWLRKVVEGA